MGLAIDSVVFTALNPGAAPAAGNAVVNAGDSAQIRNFTPTGTASIDVVSRQGATEGFVELRSPLFHDNVRGLHYITAETPTVLLMPQQVGQPARSADTLTITLAGGGAETDAGFMGVYYSDLPGAAAKLQSWANLSPLVQNIKPVEVDFTTTALGLWLDTVITTTENLLKADTWYALLGYITDVPVNAIGIKCPETANLRICGPGATSTFRTDEYFLLMDARHGRPYIPTFSANNRAAIFVSASAVAAAATKCTLILAELAKSYQGG
jgi:hypothetical protein